MKLLTILASLIIIFGSCSKSDEQEDINPTKRLTVIVYIVAENDLEKYATEDIDEMKMGAKDIPLDCNLVVYLDDNKAPRIIEINAQQGAVESKPLTECDSADPEVMKQHLQTIINSHPSDHYALVLWSHGSGWIPPAKNKIRRRTIFNDNNWQTGEKNSTEMAITDFRNALEQLSVKHWEYMLFDACFMQCVESDYELRNLTDYIIASPAEIPGNGAPYDKIMKAMMSTGKDAALGIAKGYETEYYPSPGIVISVVQTDQLEPLLKTTKELIPDFYEQAPSTGTSTIQRYAPYDSKSLWIPEFYDMASTMSFMMPLPDYERWHDQLTKTVIYALASPYWPSRYSSFTFYPRITDPDHLALLSIFIPNIRYFQKNYNQDIKQMEWYKDFNRE